VESVADTVSVSAALNFFADEQYIHISIGAISSWRKSPQQ
jgi:hypothetical protein